MSPSGILRTRAHVGFAEFADIANAGDRGCVIAFDDVGFASHRHRQQKISRTRRGRRAAAFTYTEPTVADLTIAFAVLA